MPDPPNYAFEPQSPRDSGCLRMVLAGLLGVIVGVLLTIVVEASILPGLFDRVHDLFSRKPVAEAPLPPGYEEEQERSAQAVREMEEMVRRKQEELRKDLKQNQEEVEGNGQ